MLGVVCIRHPVLWFVDIPHLAKRIILLYLPFQWITLELQKPQRWDTPQVILGYFTCRMKVRMIRTTKPNYTKGKGGVERLSYLDSPVKWLYCNEILAIGRIIPNSVGIVPIRLFRPR